MNVAESNGESSCKGQENGDASNGSERPLKKARFAWQVKGKYHLKNEESESLNSAAKPEQLNKTESSNELKTNSMGSEENLEILGDYLLKQDFNTLDSVITDTDEVLLTPNSSVSTEQLQYPRYVSSYDNNESYSVNTNSDRDSDEIMFPISMVLSQNYTEDQCIAKWQARQMAKGFVDNRINHVLDSWIHAPPEGSSGFLALEVADFINNLPGANSVENEGILMAISAHGLQNTTPNRSNEYSNCASGYSLSSRYLSPLQSDDEDTTQLSDLQKYSSISYQCDGESKISNVDCDEEDTHENHYDYILDEAVLLAIHNKGLTTLETDYG